MGLKRNYGCQFLCAVLCAFINVLLFTQTLRAQTIIPAPNHYVIADSTLHAGDVIVEAGASLTFGSSAALSGNLVFQDGAGSLLGTVSLVGNNRRFDYIGSDAHDIVISNFVDNGTDGVFAVDGGLQGVQFNGDIAGFETLELNNSHTADFYGTLSGLQNINVSGGGQLALSSASIAQDIAVTGTGSRFVSDGYASVTARHITAAQGGVFDATNDTVAATDITLVNGGHLYANGAILDAVIVLEQTGHLVFDENTQFNGDLDIDTSQTPHVFDEIFHLGGGDQIVTLSGTGTHVHLIGFDGGSGATDQLNLSGGAGAVTIDNTLSHFDLVNIGAGKTLALHGTADNLGIVSVFGVFDVSHAQGTYGASKTVVSEGGAFVSGRTVIDGDLEIKAGAAPISGTVIMGAGDDNAVTLSGTLLADQSLQTGFDGGGGQHDALHVTTQGASFDTILGGSISRFENIVMGTAGAGPTNVTLTGMTHAIDRISIVNGVFTYDSSNVLDAESIVFENAGADIGILNWVQGTLNAGVTGNTSDQIIRVADSGNLTVGASAIISDVEQINVGDGGSLTFDSAAGFSGDVRGTDSAQTFDINAGIFHGGFDTGAGADTVRLANTQLIGGFDGGVGGDSIVIDGGAVTMSAPIQRVRDFEIQNATFVYDSTDVQDIATHVTGGAGADALVIKRGGFKGFVDLGGGSNTVTINTTDGVTLGNVYDTGHNALSLEHGDLALTGHVAVDSYSYAASDSRLRLEILNSTDYANLTLTGTSGLDITGDMGEVLDVVLVNPSLVQSGDSFTLVHDMGAGNLAARFAISSPQASLFTRFVEDETTADVYRVTLQTSLDGVFKAGAKQDIGSNNLTNVAQAVLAAPVGSSNLGQVRAAIAAAPTAQAASLVLDPLMPASDIGYQQGGLAVAAQAAQSVDARLGGLRGGGMASGDAADMSSNVWSQALGAISQQSRSRNMAAYDAHTLGLTVGADRMFEQHGTVIGVVASYGATDIESKNANRTARDIDSYQVGLYADHDVGADVFVTGQVSYTLSRIDQVRHDVGAVGTHAKSRYSSHQFAGQLAVGQTWHAGGLQVTPKLSTNYNYIMTDDYQEQGADALNLNVRADDTQTLNVGAALELAWPLAGEDGALFVPRLHVGYGRDIISGAVDSVAHFAGGGGSFVTQSAAPAKDTGMVGTGFTYQSGDVWRIEADYNLTARAGYIGHTGSVRGVYRF